jgi:hypothetical protein
MRGLNPSPLTFIVLLLAGLISRQQLVLTDAKLEKKSRHRKNLPKAIAELNGGPRGGLKHGPLRFTSPIDWQLSLG